MCACAYVFVCVSMLSLTSVVSFVYSFCFECEWLDLSFSVLLCLVLVDVHIDSVQQEKSNEFVCDDRCDLNNKHAHRHTERNNKGTTTADGQTTKKGREGEGEEGQRTTVTGTDCRQP